MSYNILNCSENKVCKAIEVFIFLRTKKTFVYNFRKIFELLVILSLRDFIGHKKKKKHCQ